MAGGAGAAGLSGTAPDPGLDLGVLPLAPAAVRVVVLADEAGVLGWGGKGGTGAAGGTQGPCFRSIASNLKLHVTYMQAAVVCLVGCAPGH
eukprot:831491-Pelagomonas_calceolata.AAC.6